MDSGFHAVDSGFQYWIPDSCQWNLDSGFESLVGFWIPYAVFRIPKPRIPDSTIKISPIPDSTSKNFPDSGIRITLHGLKSLLILSTQTISVILEQNACTHYLCSLWIGDKRPFCLYYQSFILCELTLFWS